MPIPPSLQALLAAAGPSGYETAPAAAWRAAAAEFAQVAGDTLGSSCVRVAGAGEAPRLAVFGHIDEIGLIVTHIDDEGFLYFTNVGGWDSQVLVGQRVTLLAREQRVPGVVGRKPIHLLRGDDRKKVVELRDMHIDIGARDGEHARELVRVGDVAVIAADPVELPGERVVARALDNRLGAYVALEAARRLAEGDAPPGEVVAVANVQEEITFAGSRTSAFSLEPDVAIVVDVTHATDAPGVEAKQLGKHELGSGAVIDRGSIINPRVFELLCEAAEAEEIAFTIEASGRSTGTDADAVHLTKAGVPTGVVSMPLRYMHSPVELVDLADVEACVRLVVAFARRLAAGATFER